MIYALMLIPGWPVAPGLLGLVPKQLKVVVHPLEESLAQIMVLHELVYSNHTFNNGYPWENEGESGSRRGGKDSMTLD